MALKRKCYGSDDLEEALKRIDAGEKIALVSRELGIPRRTLIRKLKIGKPGQLRKPQVRNQSLVPRWRQTWLIGLKGCSNKIFLLIERRFFERVWRYTNW